jgi:3-methyl-2-oxobutanoate hydroxymethyltransferase
MAAPGAALRRTASTSSSLIRNRILTGIRTPNSNHILACRCQTLSSTLTPLSFSQSRYSSYSSPTPTPSANGKARKKVTIQTLQNLYKKGEPITMLTAHDFPSAHVADASGMDMVLVGDSLGMVALGLDNTTEVVMEEMIMHCRSVVRGAKSAFIVSWHRNGRLACVVPWTNRYRIN